jgi:hypothetical protein
VIYVLGVDGGVSGAFALLGDDGSLQVENSPTQPTTINGHVRQRMDFDELLARLRFWPITHIFYEKGQEIPRVGEDGRRRPQSGMYSYGEFNGIMIGAAAALRLPWTIVDPGKWKRKLHLLGKDKEASRALATEIFGSDKFWSKKSHHNRAEAALIAHYGMRELTSRSQDG